MPDRYPVQFIGGPRDGHTMNLALDHREVVCEGVVGIYRRMGHAFYWHNDPAERDALIIGHRATMFSSDIEALTIRNMVISMAEDAREKGYIINWETFEVQKESSKKLCTRAIAGERERGRESGS